MKNKKISLNDDNTKYISTFLSNKNIYEQSKIALYKGIALSNILLSVFLIFGLIYVSLKPKTEIPYVIEVNNDGEAKYINNAVAKFSNWEPSKTTVMQILSTYIKNLRSISTDKNIQTENIRSVYAFSTHNAIKVISEYLKNNSPIDRSEKETVRIDVYAITPNLNTNNTIYQLDWNEKTYSLSGNLKNEKNYRAQIEVGFYRPRTKNLQELNPLGIYVEDIEISEIKDGYTIK